MHWGVMLVLLTIYGYGHALTLEWTWDAPRTSADGTPLTDLAHYRLYQGTQRGTHGQIAEVSAKTRAYRQDVPATSIGQTLYNVVTAVDTSGNESAPSAERAVVVAPPVPVQWATVNVMDYGAMPNDGQHDTGAIRNAVEAVNNAGGGVVFFPEGTWDIYHLPLSTADPGDTGAPPLTKAPKHITLLGTGEDTRLRRRPHSQPHNDQRRLMTIGNAEDFTLMRMTLDMNGEARYGGVGFFSCQRCTVAHTRVIDSAPKGQEERAADRYAYVFGFGGEMHRDIWLYENRIEDGLQIEVDHMDGATISGNTLIKPRHTAGIGVFALFDDLAARNIRIVNNTLIDPDNDGGAISVQLDFIHAKPAQNRTVEHVEIIGNRIEYTALYGKAPSIAIRVGVGDNSIPTSGNRLTNARILDNTLVVHPSLPDNPRLIFGNTSTTSQTHFHGVTVAHNTLQGSHKGGFVDVKKTDQSTVAVYNNVIVPYQEDPEVPSEPGKVVLAINAGGPAYTDAAGVQYQADSGFRGGVPAETLLTQTIAGTPDARLYASMRQGDSFRYAWPLPNGAYEVTLKFAEKVQRAKGARVFDVLLEREVAIPGLDIYAVAGRRTAYDVTLPVTVRDGELNLAVVSRIPKAILSGIVVRTLE